MSIGVFIRNSGCAPFFSPRSVAAAADGDESKRDMLTLTTNGPDGNEKKYITQFVPFGRWTVPVLLSGLIKVKVTFLERHYNYGTLSRGLRGGADFGTTEPDTSRQMCKNGIRHICIKEAHKK
jgi:hypothetical protein